MSDMWTEATRDFEREASERALVQARIATAHLWPFFASAVSEEDFDNRIALSEDSIAAVVSDDATRTALVDSYRRDFQLVLAEAKAKAERERVAKAKTAASGYVLVDESKFSPEMHKRFIGYFDSEAEAKAWAEKEYGVPSDVWGDRVYVKDVGGSPETEASRKTANDAPRDALDSKSFGTVDGWDIMAYLVPDYDSRPSDYGAGSAYDENTPEGAALVEAWNNDEWSFVGVIVQAEKNGIAMGSDSLWGVEYGYLPGVGFIDPLTSDYTGGMGGSVVEENGMIENAIADARSRGRHLGSKAAGLGDGLSPGKYWAVSPNRDGNYEYFSSEEEARAAFPDQYPVPINIQDTPEMSEDQKQFLDWMGASRKLSAKTSRLSEEELDKIEFGRDEAVCRECGKVIPVNQMSSHAETHGLNSDGTEKESKKTAAEQKTKRVYQTVSVGETPDKAAMVALTMACGYGWEKNLDQIDIQVEQRGTSVLDGKPIWGVLLTGPAEVFRSGIRGERLPDDWGQKTAAGSKTASRAWNEEAVAQAMAETLVWTGSDWHNMEEGEVNPLSLDEAGYSTDDISPEGWATLRDEARQFIQGEAELLDLLPDWYGEEQLGHDIILTRQGHGTGFWDRGLGDLGNKLTDACRPYGDIDIFAQNGRLYVEGKKVAKRGSFRFRTARKVLATRTSQQLLDGTLLDPPAANSLVNLYRSLSAKNRQRFDAVPLGDLLELSKQARPQVKTSAKLRKKANAIEVSVCVDCAMFAANGELPDPEYRDPDEFVQSFNHYTEGMILVIEDGETHFSWSSCDTCGSTLGGDRFDAVLVDR